MNILFVHSNFHTCHLRVASPKKKDDIKGGEEEEDVDVDVDLIPIRFASEENFD